MKLKPCPFCGGSPKWGETEQGGVYLECQGCMASSKLMFPLKCDVKPLLVEAWNQRAEPATYWEKRWKRQRSAFEDAMANVVYWRDKYHDATRPKTVTD